ncbi:MAG: hypothetical protein ACYC27_14755 [Armatimonadota bacterium]
MSKCKHENIVIGRHVRELICYDVKDGILQDPPTPEVFNTHTVSVRCFDCGMIRMYSRSKRPKWLDKYIRQITKNKESDLI